ncbi:MAG: DNA cytosine methyltransferase [Candidatus Gracilibacteria bacterium]|nr:DNA cytosine methyltransferase [Candidatus Gracilibacteria bacterium]
MSKKIVLFEAFSGIGSQHQALKNLGYKVNIAGISDWYTDAIIAYGVNHLRLKSKSIDKKEVLLFLEKFSLSLDSKKRAKYLGGLSEEKLSILKQVIDKFGNLDIRFIEGVQLMKKNIDLFTYSFPCQDISQQGKQRGFSKESKSRSGLLWEIERILKEIYFKDKKYLPKVLLMENVKAILNEAFKTDLDEWIFELEKMGYKSTKPFIVNSADLGEAQRRERVFIVSYLGNNPNEFKLNKINNTKFIDDIFEKNLNHDLFKTNRKFEIIQMNQKTGIKKSYIKGYSNFNAESFVYFKDGKSPTITASGAQSRIKIFHNEKIIYLNAYEHLKLQGFINKDFYDNLVKYGISEAKIKFLAGNSINVKVLEEIFNFYL